MGSATRRHVNKPHLFLFSSVEVESINNLYIIMVFHQSIFTSCTVHLHNWLRCGTELGRLGVKGTD